MKSLMALVTLSLMLAACATTQRTVEPLPGEMKGWDHSGYDAARLSVVALVVENSTGDAYGAGIVYDDQGHVITAHHVIQDADRILMIASGGYTVRAEIVGIDPIFDYALLKSETLLGDRMKPAKFAKAEPKPGEPVWNLGNPFGTSRFGGEASVGHGVVSAVHRTYLNDITGRLYLDGIQHDAATNPGNSGGGIFNDRGELIGMNALITTTREMPADSGVAFAVPAYILKKQTETILRGGRVHHGWFGEESYKQATEIYNGGYGRLRAVFGTIGISGPADIAGIREGDVIIKIEDQEVFGIHEVLSLEDAYVPGQTVGLTINRAGSEFEVEILAGERPWAFE